MRADYLKHFIIGGMIGFGLLPFIGFWSVITVLIVAIAKELVWDLMLDRGHFDYKDIVYSMALPILFWFCTMMCKC